MKCGNPITGHPATPPGQPVIFSDFDGTITQADVIDQILNQLASPAWRKIEAEWVAGRIGSRECLSRQLALVNTTSRELRDLIDSIELDPHFRDFYRAVRRRRIPFYVVSDGLDYVIRRVMRNMGARQPLRNGLEFFSSELSIRPEGLEIRFPHATAHCKHGCATCKPQIIQKLRGESRPVVYIGDGLSDRFAAGVADVVLAKGRLLEFCRQQGIACTPFKTFRDVEEALLPPSANGRPAAHKASARRMAALTTA